MQKLGAVLCVALLMIAAASIPGCKPKRALRPLQTVSVAHLQAQSIRLDRTYVGRIEALMSADLHARATGYITGFFFEESDRVQKGQLLFRLDSRLYRIRTSAAAAKVAQANAAVANSRALTDQAHERAGRYLSLAATRAIPQEQYIDALVAVRVQEAALAEAQANRQIALAGLAQASLEQTYGDIRAPITGIIGMRRAGVGDLVSPDDVDGLVTISQSETVRVRVSISDADYLRYLGSSASSSNIALQGVEWRLTLADGSSYPLSGHAIVTSRAADPQTGTLELVLQFANPDNRLRPGQYAQVSAELAQMHDVLLIPVTCVRISQGSKTVLILGPGDVVAQRTIVADDRAGDSYVVTQGLAAGDRVIVGGEQKVKLGEHVAPHAAKSGTDGEKPP